MGLLLRGANATLGLAFSEGMLRGYALGYASLTPNIPTLHTIYIQ